MISGVHQVSTGWREKLLYLNYHYIQYNDWYLEKGSIFFNSISLDQSTDEDNDDDDDDNDDDDNDKKRPPSCTDWIEQNYFRNEAGIF